MLVEHARTLAGISDATHAEYNEAGTPIVTLLACSLNGVDIDITVLPGTRLSTIYGTRTATERTTCTYGLDSAHSHIVESFGMHIAAVDELGEVRAVERDDHPFFVGTLYQPQLASAPGAPHPIWRAFVAATAARRPHVH
ncbi:MAG TPA: hypothetical protein VN636_12430 [Acidimicrobiia bacterium]|nr:hypothetical protein [Acidimicrobiia bacterium]